MISQSKNLSSNELDVALQLKQSLPFFCEHLLKIKDEAGRRSPLLLTQSQKYVHDCLEKQKRETGKVRAVIVKSRQMYCSTYVEARFFHHLYFGEGKTAYILAHLDSASQNIFDMAQHYYDCLPDCMQSRLKAANAKEIVFGDTGCMYKVGTAGSRTAGRSGTIQYLHGSEVGFWRNTDDIETGLMQAIPEMPGTEIILESTANGPGNMFHRRYLQAIEPSSDYQLIFMPWHWMGKYERDVPEDFVLDDEEQELAATYLHIYDEMQIRRKLAWRRQKILDLGSPWKFKQEYPITAQEAFVVSGASLVNAEDVVRARECNKRDLKAPVVVGVDPARGGDRTVIWVRRGRENPEVQIFNDMDEMRLVGILHKIISRWKPDMINIDCAYGYGVYDRLREQGYKSVNAVHFGSKALEDRVYANKRAEMAGKVAQYMALDDINIPDDEDIHADIMSLPEFKETSDGGWRLESKAKIREVFGRSPDIMDAFMLTFAYPVKGLSQSPQKVANVTKSQAAWKHVAGR